MSSRRQAREVALQILYQLDLQEQLTARQAVGLVLDHFTIGGDQVEGVTLGDDAREFTETLVAGVQDNLPAIDAAIGAASRNWRLERMARVDRNLLRLAVYELQHAGDVPPKVAINEAIEIAKRFGTADSPSFINGILDRCLTPAKP